VTVIGSWALAFDTAIQVRRDSEVLTSACVAVPQENAQRVRRLSRTQLPGKWKHGALAGFNAVERIIRDERLLVSITHVKGDEQWQAFWDEGQRQADSLKRVTGHPAIFSGGVLSIRTTLFAVSLARAVALVLRRRGWKGPAPMDRKDWAAFSVIFDTDISEPLTQAIFIETLERKLAAGPFAMAANLDLEISACFKKEEDEPLLFLADYVAGAFNHAHPATVLGLPVAPVEEVRAAVRAFTEAQGANLIVVDHPFDYAHPLTGMTWD
jgi:hypothetical protein